MDAQASSRLVGATQGAARGAPGQFASAQLEPAQQDVCAHVAIALTAWLGWVALGLGKAILVDAFGADAPRLATRSVHHAVELGRHSSVGLVFLALALPSSRFGSRQRLARATLTCVAGLCLGLLVLSDDLSGLAERNCQLISASPGQLLALLVSAVALCPLLVSELSLVARARVARIALLALAAACTYLDSTISPMANHGAHFFLSWVTAISLGPSLLPAAARLASALPRYPRLARLSLLALVLWGVWAIAVPHRHSVQIDVARWPSSLSRLRIALWPGLERAAQARSDVTGAFFSPRSPTAELPISKGPGLPDGTITFVLSIDSFRADVLSDTGQSRHLPVISELAREGVWFDRARAPGSQTVVTLAGLSTSRYYSQQYWTRGGDEYAYWMREDSSRHFAAELSRAGVTTRAQPSAHWMQNQWGILSGFDENHFDPELDRWMQGDEITDALLDALASQATAPMLVLTHYLDSHAPFKVAGKEGSQRERYLRSLGFVDAQIGRLVAAVREQGLSERALFVITGDHGEAFGEHNMFFHGNTLYDELIRVPLIFSGAGVKPRRVSTPVSLVDVGPTLLDLYRVPIPESFMGQSLLPLLRGDSAALRRPIVSEGLLRRAMVFGDGYKVIVDAPNATVEIYDLARDPGELHNLSDELDPTNEEHVLALHHFFDVHSLRRNGYVPPLRK